MDGTMRRRRGAALTEFCLCAPFLVLIVSAIIEFGFLLSASLLLEDAARDGARWGAKGRDDAAITAICRAYAPTVNMLSPGVRIDVFDSRGAQLPAGSRVPGSRLEVTVTTSVRWLTPLVAVIGSTPVTLTARAAYRVETP